MKDDLKEMIEVCTSMLRKKGFTDTMTMLSALQKDTHKYLDPIHEDDVKMLALAMSAICLEEIAKSCSK